ncbi:MAG: hypothetical protein SOY35_04470 [Blautia sp.]|nr:hypothetical protein [Blautia sp.]MDY4115141.1 hypothetical protein [Blautia sp.]
MNSFELLSFFREVLQTIVVALLAATLIFGGGYACGNLSKTKDRLDF